MFLEMNFKSNALGKNTQVSVLLPRRKSETDAPCKTLYLLHGLKGDHTSWMRNTAIERYVLKYDLAVIMPNADRSWYTNTAYGMHYFDYITKELPELCHNTFRFLSQKREDTLIAGLSMGGYGALKAALTFPEQYGTCISLSGSLDVTRKGRTCNLPEWKSIFGFTMEDPLSLEGSEHDLFALAERNKAAGKEFPALYTWCGTEDTLIDINRSFDRHLSALGVAHEFHESEGDHTWRFWDLHIQNALSWALGDPV